MAKAGWPLTLGSVPRRSVCAPAAEGGLAVLAYLPFSFGYCECVVPAVGGEYAGGGSSLRFTLFIPASKFGLVEGCGGRG